MCNPNNDLCSEGTYCGSPVDYGLSLEDDGLYENGALQYGISYFDNIGNSALAVF